VKHTSFCRHRSVKLSVPPTGLTREAASTHTCSRFATADSSQSELLHNKLSSHNTNVPWALASTTLLRHAVYWQNARILDYKEFQNLHHEKFILILIEFLSLRRDVSILPNVLPLNITTLYCLYQYSYTFESFS